MLKRHREWTYMPPAASSSELARAEPLLASRGSGLMNKIFIIYRIMVALITMWAQLLRRQVAFGYMGCGAMYNLGTNFL